MSRSLRIFAKVFFIPVITILATALFVAQITLSLRAAADVSSLAATRQSAQPTATPTANSTMTASVSDSTNKVSRIAFVANRNGATNIYSMDPDGKDIVQLTNTTQYKLYPTWSPDGKFMVYLVGTAAGKPPLLMVINADGTNTRQIAVGKAIAISPPCWSPDSKQIAYISVRARASDSGLYIIDVAANTEHKLVTSTPINFSYTPPANRIAFTDAFAPSWSPDGNRILLFGGLGTADKTTLMVTRDGKTVRPFFDFGSASFTLMTLAADCFVPGNRFHCIGAEARWSPDGSSVLFALVEKGILLGHVIADSSGIAQTPLFFDAQISPYSLTWSPDGTQIVFSGINSTTRIGHIFTMDINITNNINIPFGKQLTDDTFSQGDAGPSWGMIPADLVKR